MLLFFQVYLPVERNKSILQGIILHLACDYTLGFGSDYMHVIVCYLTNCYFFSDLQIYYISSSNADGTDADCQRLGLKKLEEYDPCQRRWVHLKHLAEGNSVNEEMLSYEDELFDDNYYPGLPFAAIFSCCKVMLQSYWLL